MKYLAIICFILFSLNTLSQNRASISYFGNAALDYRAVPPQPILSSAMNSTESAASICNEQGDLLFYSNGGDSPTAPSIFGGVWNANNQLMENGDLTGLGGCISSYQGATIIPIDTSLNKIGNNTLYYLITTDCVESSFSGNHFNAGLRYSVIDMSFNNGLGKVIEKNVSILPFSSTGVMSTSWEPVAAISNANDKDYWIFGYHNDSLFSINFGYNHFGNYRSYFKSGRKITIAPNGGYLVTDNNLYELNNANGDLQLMFDINSNKCAFSSNGKVLYTAENDGLYQYDLEAFNIEASKTFITVMDDCLGMFLGGDYKIYTYISNSSFIYGCIHCPNNIGASCGFSQQQFSLGGKDSGIGYTNIPANLLYKDAENCILGLEEDEIMTMNIYPNPSTNKITVSSSDLITKIELYSVSGQLMIEKIVNQSSLDIDLSSIEKGMYILKVKNYQHEFSIYRLEKQ